MNVEIKQLDSLPIDQLTHLVEESKKDGFRFLERLISEYKEGINTFNQLGEALFGVYHTDGSIIAIGGLNRDPYLKNQKTGRIRRFYISKRYRKKGIGRSLVAKIVEYAKVHYSLLVLYTDTKQADHFYRSVGFIKKECSSTVTHYLKLHE